MCIKLVELITVRGTVLGRGNEELAKLSLLVGLLLPGGERRGWQREWLVERSWRDLARAWGRKCRHPDRRASTRCIQIDVKRFGGSIHPYHYLRHRLFLLNRLRLLGSHEINAALKRHGQVFPFTRTIDGGRAKPGPPIDGYPPKFFQVEAGLERSCCRKTRSEISILVPDRVVLLNFERRGWNYIGAIVPVIDYMIKRQSRETLVRTPNQNKPEYQRSTSES